jgi:hypothetical protein
MSMQVIGEQVLALCNKFAIEVETNYLANKGDDGLLAIDIGDIAEGNLYSLSFTKRGLLTRCVHKWYCLLSDRVMETEIQSMR